MRSAVVAVLVGAVVADHMETEAGFGSDYNCPGSGSWVHARMKVTVQADAFCADVEAEIQARANGAWTDPHNGGIYSLLSRVNQSDPDSDSQRDQFYKNVVIDTQRTSNPATAVGGKLYTDRQTFELNTIDGGCQIKACSDSQGFSVGDFSTNYCDLRNLYCGSSDGCVTAVRDFTHREISHENPPGSGHDSSPCNVRTTPAPSADSLSIVATAQVIPDLSTLVDALVQADLVDALSGDGPFTLFAPTNGAFDRISSVVANLTMEQLQQVLEYHVVSGLALQQSLPYWARDIGFPLTNFTDMQVLIPLLSGHSLSVDLEGGNARIIGEINTVTVSVTDVLCTNGVVHIVDAVLIPNLALAAAAPKSIVETAQATPELSSLVGALVQADLVNALSGDGPFTVFAPTNEAFDAISSVVAGLTMEQLQHVLEYHVVSGAAVKSSDLTNMEVIFPLYSGHSLGVDLEEVPNVRIVGENNAVTVSVANVLCTNGVVHIVDAVLIPNLARVISV